MPKLVVERGGEPKQVFRAYYIVPIDSDETLRRCREIEKEAPCSEFYYKEVLPLVHEDFGENLTIYRVNTYVDGDGSWVPGHVGSGSMTLFFCVTVSKN